MPTGYEPRASTQLVQRILYLLSGLVLTMAGLIRTVSPVVPLRGSNYPTWKLQCQMVVMKVGLWWIVNSTDKAPEAEVDAEVIAKYTACRNSALAHNVLSVDPTLLYLLGNPEDPVAA